MVDNENGVNTDVLTWKLNTLADGYEIYQSQQSNFTASKDNYIAVIKGGNISTYTTKTLSGGTYYFLISSYKDGINSCLSVTAPIIPLSLQVNNLPAGLIVYVSEANKPVDVRTRCNAVMITSNSKCPYSINTTDNSDNMVDIKYIVRIIKPVLIIQISLFIHNRIIYYLLEILINVYILIQEKYNIIIYVIPHVHLYPTTLNNGKM